MGNAAKGNEGNELYEFENVPALVCRQCAEVWLEAEVGQLIGKIR